MARRFLYLTRERIRQLAPDDHLTERGIRVDIEADGDQRWSVDKQVNGQRICRILGLGSNGITRSDCEAFLDKHSAAARSGQLALPVGRKLPRLLEELGEFHLAQLRDTGGKDYVNAEQHWRLRIRPYFTGRRIDDITPLDVEKFRAQLRNSGLSAGMIHNILASWRRMGNKLVQWRVLPAPLPKIPLSIPQNARERVLSISEAKALLQAARRDSNPAIWLFIRLALGTSLRHSEILSARWAAFNAERGRLGVRAKGGVWRQQPLPRTIVALLPQERQQAADPDGWLFPTPRSTTGHVSSMGKAFARCVTAAGLDPHQIIPHTLRHTAITDLANRSVPIKTLQAFSGHRSVTMVLRYTHAQEAAIDAALVHFDPGDGGDDGPRSRAVARESRESPDEAVPGPRRVAK